MRQKFSHYKSKSVGFENKISICILHKISEKKKSKTTIDYGEKCVNCYSTRRSLHLKWDQRAWTSFHKSAEDHL